MNQGYAGHQQWDLVIWFWTPPGRTHKESSEVREIALGGFIFDDLFSIAVLHLQQNLIPVAITLNIDSDENLLTSFLINPPSNYFPIPFHNKGEYCDCKDCRGKYTLIQDEEDPRLLKFHKPLPCYGCGIGWCSLLLGCFCPLLWYIATVLYFCKYYNRDPRERDGLVACVFAALICTVAISITIAVIFL